MKSDYIQHHQKNKIVYKNISFVLIATYVLTSQRDRSILLPGRELAEKVGVRFRSLRHKRSATESYSDIHENSRFAGLKEEFLTNSQVHHCLSIDVEGFVEGMAESFTISESYYDSSSEAFEIEANVDTCLELFDELNIKATFFILGSIARSLPQVVKRIALQGHEIASHSFCHKRIYGQSRKKFAEDANRSKHLLEDVSGRKIYGFRAPDFSVTSETLWELDVLLEAGYRYDSSMTPTNVHDVYGNPSSGRFIFRLPNGLWEFPAATFSFLGKSIPFGGGGYLRLYPIWLTRFLIRTYTRQNQPCMLYAHPYEVGSKAVRVSNLSLYRRFRHYYNIGAGLQRIRRIANGFNFIRAIDILKSRADGLII